VYLPPKQEELEKQYKQSMLQHYGIEFNRLITITNVPIKRFKDYLVAQGEYDEYMRLLKDNFNCKVVENIMCRTFLSVGYDGRLYDCDFNQALGLALKDKEDKVLTIDKLRMNDLEGREIIVGEHCFACTAGAGSSCKGALEADMRTSKERVIEARDNVRQYYGKVLKKTADLKTNVCCSSESIPQYQKDILQEIEPEIISKFYGCGSPIPPALEGCTVLDLGCGSGRDVYIVSRLVGPQGRVIGVDMTDEQLDVARRYLSIQTKKFGYAEPNVEFKKGYIENLKEIGIADNSVDVVISNCVINLSADKYAVFSEIFRVLKPGGELYFSDIFTNRRVPDYLRDDPVLHGECLGGALYIEDFRRLLQKVGCFDYRVFSSRKISLGNKDLQRVVGMIDFYSMTIRAFKLALEDICEDYGQIATYLGTLITSPHRFILDAQHIFITGKPVLVCGNTASMLQDTRYAKYFQVSGDKSVHFGPFNCTAVTPDRLNDDFPKGGCC
jgi:ubiquinone/menaquinone biosynthesis C-methylase UbiE